jgi:lysophospholipase L1-like esterase
MDKIGAVKVFTPSIVLLLILFLSINPSAASVYLSDDFSDGNAAGWTVVDDGWNSGPSNWGVVSGVYRQTSNLWGTASGGHQLRDDQFFGTYAYRGSLSWGDYILQARVRSTDNDQIGLMFRYQDNDNYYRFFMDNQRGVRRLEKKVGGVFTVLAEDYVAYTIGQWYGLRIEVLGSEIRVLVDGVEIFHVVDSSLSTGMIALYCWGNVGANFDDIVVEGTTAAPSDTTAPVWDSGVGICSASDHGGGNAVVVEFGSATDDIDGSAVSYNIYYAPTTSWDHTDWTNNNVLLDVSPGGGTSCLYSFTLTGLQNGVEYTFGVRVEDQSGNEDNNTNIAAAIPTLYENFNDNSLDRWVIINNSTRDTPNWYVANGILTEDVYIRGQTIDGYDIGTYCYLDNFSYGDGEIRARLRSQGIDSIGIMFRYQDDDNYYRFSMSKRQGYRKIEKKVAGIFTELSSDTIAYTPNIWYDLKIINIGPNILVYLNGEPILSAVDYDLDHGSIAFYNSRNALSEYDDLYVITPPSQPLVVIANPTTNYVYIDNYIDVKATVINLPLNGYVDFILDEGTTSEDIRRVFNSPFGALFDNVPTGDHTLDVYVRDSNGVQKAHDQNTQIGTGGNYYVGVGDSITDSVGDDDPTDDISSDLRNSAGGYQSPLNDLLTNFTGIPHTVIDEGTPADTSENGVNKINTILARNPSAQYILILYGTNDSSGTLPVDKLTFKNNLQQIITAVINAGKIPIVGKVPFALGSSTRDSVIQTYNQAIDELYTENNLTHIPPDFYAHFKYNYLHQNGDEFFDNLHPNGKGYRSMATLWFESIYPPN